MEYPCSGCAQEVRARQEALLCDRCNTWRHRTCGTGMPRGTYRHLMKMSRDGAPFAWYCPECPQRGIADFVDMDDRQTEPADIADQPADIADQPADIAGQPADIADQPADIADQPADDFDIDVTIDEGQPPEEPLIADDRIPDDLPDDRPTEFIIVEDGTQRRGKRLHDTHGFTYTKKKDTKAGAYWVCSVRSVYGKCHATVIQRGDTFCRGTHPHTHAAPASSLLRTKIRAAVKRRAVEEEESSGRQIHADSGRSHSGAAPAGFAFITETRRWSPSCESGEGGTAAATTHWLGFWGKTYILLFTLYISRSIFCHWICMQRKYLVIFNDQIIYHCFLFFFVQY